MKADAASGWLSGMSAGSASGASGANGVRSEVTGEPKPAFDRLLRRASSPAGSERGAATASRERDAMPARERPQAATTGAPRAITRDTRADTARSDEPPASETATTEPYAGREAPSPAEDHADPATWLPPGLVLPVMPPPPGDPQGPAALPPSAAGDAPPVLPSMLAAGVPIGNAPVAEPGLAGDGPPGIPALPFGEAAVASRTPADAKLPATPAAATALALPPSDAATAGEAPPSALVAGLAALKDMTGDAGNDTDAPAPAFALPGAPAPVSDHGLARTATVNPLTAMTPDLRGDRFGDTLGTQMTWMAEQKIGHAHIRVSPGDLGAIEVNLRLDGDRVHADFSSAQPEVRQALQDSLPRLREMLGQQGFQLAQADVGHRQQSSSQSSTPSQSSADGRGDGNAVESGQGVVTTTVRTLRGLLDAYA